MEKERKDQMPLGSDFLLQWGSRKRLRCAKVKGIRGLKKSEGAITKKMTSPDWEKETPLHLNRISRNSDSAEENKSRSASPLEEDRYYYPTRGSGLEDVGKGFGEGMEFVWPKFFISLSCKEKEEDFMAMKGCKLPQRPKKRAKIVQRFLRLVSPGAWLSELSQDRYEVRERKSSKKRARGLKAMGSMDSDFE